MHNSTFFRTIRAFALAAALAQLAACGGGGDNASDGDANDSVADTMVEEEEEPTTVVFQITGLALLVPPNTARQPVRVLLPQPSGLEDHVALLGFMRAMNEAEAARLCLPDSDILKSEPANICYAQLDKWELQPFGRGGWPSTTTARPDPATSGLLNVSHLSGGRHLVRSSLPEGQPLAQLMFAAGKLGRDPCKLASWLSEPADAMGRPQPGLARRLRLANVVTWEIERLVDPTFVFVRRDSTADTIRVPLLTGDTTSVLLAHIPVSELGDLPPNQRKPVRPLTSTKARHFDAYYDLLKSTDARPTIPPGSDRRRIPRTPRGLETEACRVKISTVGGILPAVASVATYACMPAYGEGGS